MKFIKSSSFLITGGTGSFGETMIKQLINRGCPEIKILSRDEKKQEDLRNRFKNKSLKFYIADVRDPKSIEEAFKNTNYVFHAAALKQVPSCEFYPLEALKTNVIGTENVINASISNHVKKLILLSTDKAVYPVNAMGMSKAMAEKILIAKSRILSNKETILSSTRYGNVMGSRGSVIPLFINQIKKNEDVTITDPNMSRFLMSLDDSIKLVFEAFQKSKQGDIFIMKSPSVKMLTLAKALIKIFQSKSKVQIIGTRHGEKLYETLVSREEKVRSKENSKYYVIKADNRNLDYSQYFSRGKKKLSNESDYDSHNTKILNTEEVIRMLKNVEFIKKELNK